MIIRILAIAAGLTVNTAAFAQQTETPPGNVSPPANCAANTDCKAARPDTTQSTSDRNEAGRAATGTAPTSGSRADGGGSYRDPSSIHSGAGTNSQ
ncbi:hypothetical protein [Flaviflagellibacter deserti]|uniref:Uncharacterized protein n=1 Tax=Flaviflagellibacter deserti TaxID=2267266 RepID=A0ABV9Z387_9HYPH